MTVRVARAARHAARLIDRPRGRKYQVIDGFGATMRARSHPDFWGVAPNGTGGAGAVLTMTTAQTTAIFDALYDPAAGVGLSRVRTCDPTTGTVTFGGGHHFPIEDANDNTDPMVYNAAGFTYSGPRLDDIATEMGFARARGAKTWQSALFSERWMTGHTSATPTVAVVQEYAEWLLAIARRYSAQGQPLNYLSIANEPSYSRNTMSGEFIRDVIRNLGPRLDAEGLLIPIVIPDDVRASNAAAKTDTIMADAVARRYVGALATHPYDEAESNMALMAQRASTYKLPLWQTELSIGTLGSMPGSTATAIGWATAVHNMLTQYDCAAVDFMFGMFAQEDPNYVLVAANYAAGAYTGHTINIGGRYMGQWARYVRPGDRRVEVNSTNAAAKVSMFHRPRARAVVAINATGSPVTTDIGAPDLSPVSSVTPIRSSATEQWATQTVIAVTAGSFTATLPATSVTTFVGTMP